MPEIMKAITIWQPWASLWACGAKKFETRSWFTSYRGPIAIHAGKILCHRFSCEVDGNIFAPAVNAALWPGEKFTDSTCELDTWHGLPRGAVIATAELIGCHKITNIGWSGSVEHRIAWIDGQLSPHYPTEREMLLGDWTPGRYAWEIANVKMLETPIPTKGKQRLWDWENAS